LVNRSSMSSPFVFSPVIRITYSTVLGKRWKRFH
jgi:hypothetical protein